MFSYVAEDDTSLLCKLSEIMDCEGLQQREHTHTTMARSICSNSPNE